MMSRGSGEVVALARRGVVVGVRVRVRAVGLVGGGMREFS